MQYLCDIIFSFIHFPDMFLSMAIRVSDHKQFYFCNYWYLWDVSVLYDLLWEYWIELITMEHNFYSELAHSKRVYRTLQPIFVVFDVVDYPLAFSMLFHFWYPWAPLSS